MGRALGPRPELGARPDLAPFVVIAACWVPFALAGDVWVGGHAASTLSGHGWAGPPFGVNFAIDVATRGPRAEWPAVPAGLVWVLSGLLAAAVTTPVVVVLVRWRNRQGRSGEPLGSLATPGDVAGFTPKGAAAVAVRLRPSLRHRPLKDLAGPEVGVPLGRLRPGGAELRASWEDVQLWLMAPRTGKTSAGSVPMVLDAPGAVVATSNKADLWALTAAARACATGERVWVFDPQRIAHQPRTWWWNPLAGVVTVEAAQRLATHFLTEVRGDTQREFWSSAAEDVLSALFLAAGAGGSTLADVFSWLNHPTSPVPVDVLRHAGHPATAEALAGRQAGATETREGIFETARTAAKCLRNPDILAWVTPPAAGGSEVEEFDPGGFAASRQTLYLLSKDSAGGAAPLVAAFADRVIVEAVQLAERRGGRLDPPLLVVLDEAANVCKIADLPKLYSHLGSRGIIPVTILQSYPQGEVVWGKAGMDTLWAAATVKLVGSGIDDETFLEKVSRLIGDHDVPTRALHYSAGSNGENVSLRRQRILPPEELRRLPKGSAVLLATGARPALVELQPWYLGPRSGELGAASDAALADLTRRAQSPEETAA